MKSRSELDLRGVPCPLSWARAKVRLEAMSRGDLLDLLVDDPKGQRDIPRAAEAEGFCVVEIDPSAGALRIRIEK